MAYTPFTEYLTNLDILQYSLYRSDKNLPIGSMFTAAFGNESSLFDWLNSSRTLNSAWRLKENEN